MIRRFVLRAIVHSYGGLGLLLEIRPLGEKVGVRIGVQEGTGKAVV